jgi:hypothetical protein
VTTAPRTQLLENPSTFACYELEGRQKRRDEELRLAQSVSWWRD